MIELPILQPPGGLVLDQSIKVPPAQGDVGRRMRSRPLEEQPLEIADRRHELLDDKMLTRLEGPAVIDARGRFTQEKADGPPRAHKAVQNLQPVFLAKCPSFTRRVRRRFESVPGPRQGDKAVATLTGQLLRHFDVSKTRRTAGLVRMLLASSAKPQQRRPRFKLSGRRTTWLNSKPLVAVESVSSLLAHLAVQEKEHERSRGSKVAVMQTGEMFKRWRSADDKAVRPGIAVLDEYRFLRHAQAAMAKTDTASLRRKAAGGAQRWQQAADGLAKLPSVVGGSSEHWQRLKQEHLRETRLALLADGRVWERPITHPVPAFVNKQNRRATILTVTDLAGGTDKSTVAAELAARLTEQGDRVLLVDLDYRGTLSKQFLTNETRSVLRAAKRTAVKWLEPFPCRDGLPLKCLQAVGREMYAVAADESLGVWEARERAAWLVRPGQSDVRFRLRAVLHSEEICQRFDWVLLDCPARLSTATINALTASDHLLLSAAPGEASRALTGQMLGWLARLNVLNGACRGLSLLGTVDVDDSKTDSQPADETRIPEVVAAGADWSRRIVNSEPRWRDGVYHFSTTVPSVAAEAHAAGRLPKLPTLDKRLPADRFAKLAAEVKDRVAVRGGRF